MAPPCQDPSQQDPSLEVCGLYRRLIRSWNDCHAPRFSALLADHATVIGFDGTVLQGKDAVFEHLDEIFGVHEPPRYVVKIRTIRALADNLYFLLAVAGMVHPGHDSVDPALHSIQTLIVRKEESWLVEHFQNTPAAYHGREEDREALTWELDLELSQKAIDESLTHQLMLW